MVVNGASIITCTCKPHCLDTIIDNFTRQRFVPKELVIVINNNNIDMDLWQKNFYLYDNIKIFRTDESITLGESFNYGAKQAEFNYLFKFDDDDYYGPNYLVNTINAFKNSNADIVGKSNIFVYFNKSKMLATHKREGENTFISKFIAGATISFKKKVFDKVQFQHLPSGVDRIFIAECLANNFTVYSADIHDYACIRYGNVDKHTWKIEDNIFMNWCTPVKKIEIKNFYTIVNNETTSSDIL